MGKYRSYVNAMNLLTTNISVYGSLSEKSYKIWGFFYAQNTGLLFLYFFFFCEENLEIEVEAKEITFAHPP